MSNEQAVDKSKYLIEPGAGLCYEWMSDTIVVKLSGEQTGGLFTLIQDNLNPGFDLGWHLHKTHSESFYILEGHVEFIVDKDKVLATPGTTIHVPPGIPHRVHAEKAAKMLMLYCPAGFELALAAMKQLTDAQGQDEEFMRKLNESFDIFFLKTPPT